VKATLTYHSLDDSGSAISIPPAVFDQHLAWLTSGRARALELDRIATDPDSAGDAVAVTFDDGFRNTREAIERLLAHEIPTSVFVVTGRVGGDNDWNGMAQRGIPTLPLMTWTDLEQLVAKGLTVERQRRDELADDYIVVGPEKHDARLRIGLHAPLERIEPRRRIHDEDVLGTLVHDRVREDQLVADLGWMARELQRWRYGIHA